MSEPPEIGDVVSNFDGVVDQDIERQLREATPRSVEATYPAWNFFARVQWTGELFEAEVWQYGAPVERVSAPTVEELRETVSGRYGYA